jgi:putative copper export protein
LKNHFGIDSDKGSELYPGTSNLFASSATTMSEKKEEWTKPRLHNTSAFRSIAILGVLAAAGASTKTPLGPQANAMVHLLSFATWFGTMSYTTFVVGITAFKNLDRQTFGKLQAKLFPKYFALSSIAIVLQVSRPTCCLSPRPHFARV